MDFIYGWFGLKSSQRRINVKPAIHYFIYSISMNVSPGRFRKHLTCNLKDSLSFLEKLTLPNPIQYSVSIQHLSVCKAHIYRLSNIIVLFVFVIQEGICKSMIPSLVEEIMNQYKVNMVHFKTAPYRSYLGERL